jgi:hypothetical protein
VVKVLAVVVLVLRALLTMVQAQVVEWAKVVLVDLILLYAAAEELLAARAAEEQVLLETLIK